MDKKKIGPEIRISAHKKYMKLPNTVNKGEWLSDAIEEKYDREYSNNNTLSRIEALEKRMKDLEDIVKEMMGK